MSNVDITGRFVWHELMTTDPDGAGDFYTRVVPWKTQDSGMPNYTLWMSGKDRAGGLTVLPEGAASGTPPHWLVYICTSDVDATVAAAEKSGGKVLKPAADIPNIGRFALLADPDGAVFAAFAPHAGSGDGVPAGGNVGDFTWHELSTTEPETALQFYIKLFGWSKGASHDMGEMGVYQIISHGGQDVGGVYRAHDKSAPPSWLSYVRVADATKAAEMTKQAGGRVLHGPVEVPGGSWIVMVLDPQGSAFALVEQGPVSAAKPAAPAKSSSAPASPAKTTSGAQSVSKAKATASADPAPAAAAAREAAAKQAAAKQARAKPVPPKQAPPKPATTAAPATAAQAKAPPAKMPRAMTRPPKTPSAKTAKAAAKTPRKAATKAARKSALKSVKPKRRAAAKEKRGARNVGSRIAAKKSAAAKRGSRKKSAKVGKRAARSATAKSKGKRGRRR